MRGPALKAAETYRVLVDGELDHTWAAWFDGWRVLPAAAHTVFERRGADQAALYGLLLQLRDMGLVLISVERLDTS